MSTFALGTTENNMTYRLPAINSSKSTLSIHTIKSFAYN